VQFERSSGEARVKLQFVASVELRSSDGRSGIVVV
jgi:hypothetical protein